MKKARLISLLLATLTAGKLMASCGNDKRHDRHADLYRIREH